MRHGGLLASNRGYGAGGLTCIHRGSGTGNYCSSLPSNLMLGNDAPWLSYASDGADGAIYLYWLEIPEP